MWVSGLLALLAATLRHLPLSLCKALGWAVGFVWWRLIPIRKGLVIRQIQRAFPELTPGAVRRIARRMGTHLGLNFIEFLRLDPARPGGLSATVSREGFENFERAAAKGRGVLVLTAHFGNWDLLACSQSLAGIPITIVSKTISPEGLNCFWMSTRRRCGVTILPDRGVRDTLLATLAGGGVVGLVLDQHVPARLAVATRFFGRAAATSRGLAELALDSGAPIVPIFLVREAGGRHRLCALPEIPPVPADDREAAVRAITQAATGCIEAMVRAHPEQWLWLHRRWKLEERAACGSD